MADGVTATQMDAVDRRLLVMVAIQSKWTPTDVFALMDRLGISPARPVEAVQSSPCQTNVDLPVTVSFSQESVEPDAAL